MALFSFLESASSWEDCEFYLSLKISTIISFHDCNLLCVCLSGIIPNKSGIINILRILLNNL